MIVSCIIERNIDVNNKSHYIAKCDYWVVALVTALLTDHDHDLLVLEQWSQEHPNRTV